MHNDFFPAMKHDGLIRKFHSFVCLFFFRESTYCTDLHLKPMSVIQIDLDQIIDDVIDEAMTLVLF